MHTIYGLIDPRTYAIRYVGMTSNHPAVRLQEHLDTKRDAEKKKCVWIIELRQSGLKPSVVILDFAPDITEAAQKELWWIRRGLAIGWDLTNIYPLDSRTHNARDTERKRQRWGTSSEQSPGHEWDDFAKAFYVQNPEASQRALTRAMAGADPDGRPAEAFVGGLSSNLYHRCSPNGKLYQPEGWVGKQ